MKARKNSIKHKVTFERATKIFLDPFALTIFDSEHSFGEDRYITIGKTGAENLIVVVHTFLAEIKNEITIRIISARKATKNESKQYHGANK